MLNSLFAVSIALLSILSFALGIFSIFKNPRSATVRLWFLMSLAVGIWSLAFLMLLRSSTAEQGIFYSSLLHVGASFIPIFFFHFVLSFLYQLNKKSCQIFLIVGYILASFFSFLSFTPLIVTGVSPKAGYPLFLDAGSAYPIFIIYFWFFALLSIYFLLRGYKTSDGVMKRKIFYILIASLFGFGGGGTSFLPQTLGIYAYGDFVVWLYPILVTWGIFVDEIHINIRP